MNTSFDIDGEDVEVVEDLRLLEQVTFDMLMIQHS